MSVTAVAGGRPRFFAGSLVTGVEGVLGVDSGPGAGVAGRVSVVGVAGAAAGVLFPGRPRFFCVSAWVGVLVAGVTEGVDSFVSCEGVLGADSVSLRVLLRLESAGPGGLGVLAVEDSCELAADPEALVTVPFCLDPFSVGVDALSFSFSFNLFLLLPLPTWAFSNSFCF